MFIINLYSLLFNDLFREMLADLIVLLKNNIFLKCSDLLEVARRQLQGLQYDAFIAKKTKKKDVEKMQKLHPMRKCKPSLRSVKALFAELVIKYDNKVLQTSC